MKEIKNNVINDITKHVIHYKDNDALNSPSYDTGLLGISLYFTLLYEYTSEQEYKKLAIEFLERGMYSLHSDFQPVYINDSIDNHIGQIGRYIDFLKSSSIFSEYDFEDYLLKLDQLAGDLIISKINRAEFDITCGALATGAFFLTRDNTKSDEYIRELIINLNRSKIVNDQGYCWKSPSLGNRIYLGISHGSAMIINFLASVYERGIEKELCTDLIHYGSLFLINQKRHSPYLGLFENFLGEKLEAKQFSLCYGDIGNGISLYRAGTILKNSFILEESKLILKDCLLRKYEDKLTLDASIFYGASGLSIAFEKVFYLTNESDYKLRSDYWLNTIPNYKTNNELFAGFKSRLDKESILWNMSYGWGIIGCGCAILNNQTKTFKSLSPLTFLL